VVLLFVNTWYSSVREGFCYLALLEMLADNAGYVIVLRLAWLLSGSE